MKITLKNFRKHDFLDINTAEVSAITGKTGEGKTSVLEAIIFGLYGRDFLGSIGVDRYIKNGKDDAVVMLKFPIKDRIGREQEIEVKRVITKKTSEIYLNGQKSTQAELEMTFGGIDVGLPIINPFYFMYLDDNDKRNLFMKLLPSRNKKEVFIERYGDRLADQFALATDKQAKDQVNTIQHTLDQNDVQTGLLLDQIRLDKSEIELHKSNVLKDPDDTMGDREKMRTRLAAIERQLDKDGNIESERRVCEDKLKVIVKEVKEALSKVGYAKATEAIEGLEDAVKESREREKKIDFEIAQVKASIDIFEKNIKDGTCEVCGQFVDRKQAEERLAKFKEQDFILSKKKIECLDFTRAKEQFYNKIVELHSAGKGFQKRMKEIDDYMPEYNKILEERLSLNVKLNNRDADSDLEAYKLHLESLASIKMLETRIKNGEEKVELMAKQTEKLKPVLDDTKMIVEALGVKGVRATIIKEQVKLLDERIAKYMKDVTIEVVRENKTTDGYKEVFDIFVGETPFRSLSYGEKIKVSVMFGLIIRELKPDIQLPFMLLDEASVLSAMPMRTIKSWVRKSGIDLIYTKIAETKFSFKAEENDKD